MKKFQFKKIDAFASEKSGGNPAGMVYLESTDEISSDEMQRIAAELKGFVSEVGYVSSVDENTFDLRYYSSEREVDFCGHATIAIMYDLIKMSESLITLDQINIITQKGSLSVENRIITEDAVFITSPEPVFSKRQLSPDIIAKALQTDPEELNSLKPVSVVNAGLETLIIPLKSLDGILSLSPDPDELKEFCVENFIDIITLYTDEVAHKNNSFRTRVFAPTFGYLEDPATGSGNSAFGYYLLGNSMWDGNFMTLEQNSSLDNPNIIKLKTKEKEGSKMRVLFGGGAVVRIEGEYFLQ